MQGAQDDLTPPAALASLGGLATPLSPSSSVLPNMPGKFSRVVSVCVIIHEAHRSMVTISST